MVTLLTKGTDYLEELASSESSPVRISKALAIKGKNKYLRNKERELIQLADSSPCCRASDGEQWHGGWLIRVGFLRRIHFSNCPKEDGMDYVDLGKSSLGRGISKIRGGSVAHWQCHLTLPTWLSL